MKQGTLLTLTQKHETTKKKKKKYKKSQVLETFYVTDSKNINSPSSTQSTESIAS